MTPKPNPADFTFNGVLQQPHYDNAVRAWEKMEGMEVEKAAEEYSKKFGWQVSSEGLENIKNDFKAGAVWKGQKGWNKYPDIQPEENKWYNVSVVRNGEQIVITSLFPFMSGKFWANNSGTMVPFAGEIITHWHEIPKPPTI